MEIERLLSVLRVIKGHPMEITIRPGDWSKSLVKSQGDIGSEEKSCQEASDE